ncbi:MAG: hypothetical protein WC655_17210 [Candidatus Hydrogenedentales bacterium]|jgi:hypothetical protein
MAKRKVEVPDPPHCFWTRADDDTDMWETRCKQAFQFNDGTPKQNGFKFCPYCGRKIA